MESEDAEALKDTEAN